MAPNVLSLADRVAGRAFRADWTNTELAELYRVEHALTQARISVETDRGITDEGDPWFVFCRADGEVVVHITRFGGCYHLYSPALPKPLVGPTFSALTKTFLSGLRAPVRPEEGVSIHPAALLSVLIAAIFFSIDFHSSGAHAAEAVGHGSAQAPPIPLGQVPVKIGAFQTLVANLKGFIDSVTPWDSEQSALLAAVENAAIAMSPLAGLAESTMNVLPVTPVASDVPWTDRAISPVSWDSFKTMTGLQAGLKALFSQASVVAGRQDSAQPSGTFSQNPALIWQGNQFSAIDLSGVANSEFIAPSAAVLQSDEGIQQTPAPFGAGEPLLLTRAPVDAPIAGNGALGDQNPMPSADHTLQVNMASTPQTIDLSVFAGIHTIVVSGSGFLKVSGITNAPQIDVSANSIQTLSLWFADKAQPAVKIQMNGDDAVTLATLSTDPAVHSNSAQSGDTAATAVSAVSTDTKISDPTSASTRIDNINLTLDSGGNSANNVTIAENAVSSTTKLNITVEGIQDLTLNESAQTFNNSSISTTDLTGALTVSLDLSNAFQSVDLSQVNAANFIVGNSANIALLNAASGSHIQLGSNLNTIDLTVAGATAADPGALAIDLQTSAAVAAPVGVNLLDAFYTASLTINSAGAASGESNLIKALTDTSLTTLTITGNSALAITAINGPSSSDGQNITIDAHALTASLVLNVSEIADTAPAGRSITIMAGGGTSILINDTSSEATTFVAGNGMMTVDIGAGASHDAIVGLTAADTVNVDAATNIDTVVNETPLGSAQAMIDQQTNVTAAAQLAASFGASPAAHQAVLFSYDGNLYVFVDAHGNHTFDANTDAIIELVGVAATANLAGVFHSA